jgi:hypothetical protein
LEFVLKFSRDFIVKTNINPIKDKKKSSISMKKMEYVPIKTPINLVTSRIKKKLAKPNKPKLNGDTTYLINAA